MGCLGGVVASDPLHFSSVQPSMLFWRSWQSLLRALVEWFAKRKRLVFMVWQMSLSSSICLVHVRPPVWRKFPWSLCNLFPAALARCSWDKTIKIWRVGVLAYLDGWVIDKRPSPGRLLLKHQMGELLVLWEIWIGPFLILERVYQFFLAWTCACVREPLDLNGAFR